MAVSNGGNGRKSLLMLVSSMLIFGTIGLFRKLIPLPSAFLACTRGLLGGLFVLIFMRLKKQSAGSRIPRRSFLLLALTGAMIGFNWMLLFEAYNYTTVAVATLCYYMQPTIVVLVSPLLFRERLTVRKTLCAAAAVLGMVLVSGVTAGDSAAANDPRGIFLGLGAAVLYACVIILNKKISGVPAFEKTTIQLFSAGIVMIPYLFLTSGFRFSGMEEFSLSAAVLLLIVGVVHTGIAYVLYFAGMDGLKAQSVAILSYIDPVSALLFAALFLREPLRLPELLGAALIIGSAVISEVHPPQASSSISTPG